MVKVEYSSNNSGGHWWLKDEDWYALEKAGWKVDWYKDKTDGLFSSMQKSGRFLGALAANASKDFETPDEGLREWENITGRDPWAMGCSCCGRPHNFNYTDAQGHMHWPTVSRSARHEGWD